MFFNHSDLSIANDLHVLCIETHTDRDSLVQPLNTMQWLSHIAKAIKAVLIVQQFIYFELEFDKRVIQLIVWWSTLATLLQLSTKSVRLDWLRELQGVFVFRLTKWSHLISNFIISPLTCLLGQQEFIWDHIGMVLIKFAKSVLWKALGATCTLLKGKWCQLRRWFLPGESIQSLLVCHVFLLLLISKLVSLIVGIFLLRSTSMHVLPMSVLLLSILTMIIDWLLSM